MRSNNCRLLDDMILICVYFKTRCDRTHLVHNHTFSCISTYLHEKDPTTGRHQAETAAYVGVASIEIYLASMHCKFYHHLHADAQAPMKPLMTLMVMRIFFFV